MCGGGGGGRGGRGHVSVWYGLDLLVGRGVSLFLFDFTFVGPYCITSLCFASLCSQLCVPSLCFASFWSCVLHHYGVLCFIIVELCCVAVAEGRVQPAGGAPVRAGGSCDPVSPAGQNGSLRTIGATDTASEGWAFVCGNLLCEL